MTIEQQRDEYEKVLKYIVKEGRDLGRCILGRDCRDVHCAAKRVLRKVKKAQQGA